MVIIFRNKVSSDLQFYIKCSVSVLIMLKFILRPSGLFKYQDCLLRTCTSNLSSTSADDEKERELERIAKNASIDEPPTTCCQSGCANCVYIAWAEALSTKLQDGGADIAEKVIKMVDDPSMKAYLELELRLRGLKKKL